MPTGPKNEKRTGGVVAGAGVPEWKRTADCYCTVCLNLDRLFRNARKKGSGKISASASVRTYGGGQEISFLMGQIRPIPSGPRPSRYGQRRSQRGTDSQNEQVSHPHERKHKVMRNWSTIIDGRYF